MSKNELIQIPDSLEKSAEFAEFCKWSAQPRDVRQPIEQKQLAKELGVDETTLVRWKELPEFAQNKKYYIREWLGDELPDVMQIVKKGALRGQDRKIELFLKWLGELSEGSETNVAVQVNTFTGSPEQNKELDEELINMGLCVKCLQKARKYMNL